MKDYVPLLQTILWVSMILGLVFIFRAELALLRKVFAERLRQGAAVTLGPLELGELKDELRSVRTGLNDVNKRIDNLFLATISPPMYENLKKLASGRFGPYEMSSALKRELYHLRDIGYIDVPSIKAIPNAGQDLSQHVKITHSGRNLSNFESLDITRLPEPSSRHVPAPFIDHSQGFERYRLLSSSPRPLRTGSQISSLASMFRWDD